MTSRAKVYADTMLEVLGSPRAVELYDAALDAAQAFAQATGAPAGSNVIAWLGERSDAILEAWRQSFGSQAPGERP